MFCIHSFLPPLLDRMLYRISIKWILRHKNEEKALSEVYSYVIDFLCAQPCVDILQFSNSSFSNCDQMAYKYLERL